MTQGRQREQWNHTAVLLATLINLNRDPRKGRPVSPRELHPMNQPVRRAEPVLKVDLGVLKTIFVERT